MIDLLSLKELVIWGVTVVMLTGCGGVMVLCLVEFWRMRK